MSNAADLPTHNKYRSPWLVLSAVDAVVMLLGPESLGNIYAAVRMASIGIWWFLSWHKSNR